LKRLWHILRNPKLNTSQAVERIREELGGQEEVEVVLDFIDSSERGVVLS
jgi:acyl-[acyl carrier protein]--UDP-N-acetylglucosamine O-acyltransferase